ARSSNPQTKTHSNLATPGHTAARTKRGRRKGWSSYARIRCPAELLLRWRFVQTEADTPFVFSLTHPHRIRHSGDWQGLGLELRLGRYSGRRAFAKVHESHFSVRW